MKKIIPKCRDSRMKTSTELKIRAGEVIADVRSAAWLEQELHPELDRHRRHEMADICERDNVERVWRVLGIAEAELRQAMVRILSPARDTILTNDLLRPTEWRFRFSFLLPHQTVGFLREKIHEYFVAAVMAERTGVIVPAATKVWLDRASHTLRDIQATANTARPPYSPVRRPIVF